MVHEIKVSVEVFFVFTTVVNVTDQVWLISCPVTDWFWLLVSMIIVASSSSLVSSSLTPLFRDHGNGNKWFQKQGLPKLLRMRKIWQKKLRNLSRMFDCKTCFFYKHMKRQHDSLFFFFLNFSFLTTPPYPTPLNQIMA